MKKITTEQINRFFEGQCTREEGELVANYLRENCDVLNGYILRDWDAADPQGAIPEGYSAKMFIEITAKIKEGNRVVPMRIIIMGVAAVVVLLVSGIWMLWRYKGAAINMTVAANRKPAIPTPVSEQRVRYNTGGQKETILLPDGSTVILSANSTIRYSEPFDKDKRTLFLEGKAVFKVVKEETRPFTVTAGPVITTVLGTEFSMMEEKGEVTVQLYSGKVRLHGTQKWLKDIVLTPGEQMRYEGMGKEVIVSRFNDEGFAKKARALSVPVEVQEIEFDDEPLAKVIDKLAGCYQLDLSYDEKLIANRYFTGTVRTSDSITTILQLIANMNELKIIPRKRGFIIRK